MEDNRPKLKAARFNRFSSRAVEPHIPNINSLTKQQSEVRGVKRTLVQNDEFKPKRQCFSGLQSEGGSISGGPSKNNIANLRLQRIQEKIKTELKTRPCYEERAKAQMSPKRGRFEAESKFGLRSTHTTLGDENSVVGEKCDILNISFNTCKYGQTPSKLSKNLADERLKRIRRSLELKDTELHDVKDEIPSSIDQPVKILSTTDIKVDCNKYDETRIKVDLSATTSHKRNIICPSNSSTTVPESSYINTNQRKNTNSCLTVLKSTNNKSIKRGSSTASEDSPRNVIAKKLSGFNMDSAITKVKPCTPASNRLSSIREKQKNELEHSVISPTGSTKNESKYIILDEINATFESKACPNSEEKQVSSFNIFSPEERKLPKCSLFVKNYLESQVSPQNNNLSSFSTRPESFSNKINQWFNGQEVVNNFDVTAKSDDSLVAICNDTVSSNLINEDEEMDWTNAEYDPILNGEQIATHHIENPIKNKDVCVVTDTNIFISHVDTVKNIMKLKAPEISKPIIYIPWMVLSELDNIKDNTQNSKLKKDIMQSLRLISSNLNVDGAKIVGQSVEKAALQKHISKSPDDKIIACCMQAMEAYETVVLLSNDVNLRNKAMVNDIPVCTSKDAIIVIMNKLVKNVKYQKVSRKFEMLFSSIICECAKGAYGDAWSRMDMLKCPPWSLKECLKRFKKYWKGVFHEKLLKHFPKTVDDLLRLLNENSAISDDSREYNEFMKLCLDLCFHLKDIEESRPSVEKVIEEIVKIA